MASTTPTPPGSDRADPLDVPGKPSPAAGGSSGVQPRQNGWKSILSTLQLLIALGISGAVLVWLLWSPPPLRSDRENSAATSRSQVEVTGPRTIRVQSDGPLARKLETIHVEASDVTVPLIRVTGTVLASRRPGRGEPDFWQFDTTDLLTTYSDWEKAGAEVTFAETQSERVQQLADARDAAQQEVVNRLKKLVNSGSESVKDLRQEETTLLQYKIQGQKEIHEAQSAMKVARRSAAVLERQLQQAGLEGELLKSASSDVDLIVAEVPEGKISRVQRNQSCEATFYGFADKVFKGKVSSLAPIVSKDRRTLRVLFVIHDPDDLLRPGMFAEIGLGTDSRQMVQVPVDGVVHIGRKDFLLRQSADESWLVQEVELGELLETRIEVLKGVKSGDVVMGKGAVLLKPLMVQALRRQSDRPSTAQWPSNGSKR